MRNSTRLAAVSLLALLAGCAGPGEAPLPSPPIVAAIPPSPPPPPPPPPAQAREASDGRTIVVTGQRRAQQDFAQNSAITVVGAETLASAPQATSDASRRPQPSPPESRYIRIPGVQVPVQPDNERYDGEAVSPVHVAAAEPVSTFSIDVDTGAYANARRFLTQGQLPPAAAVRTEELINYFRYDYPLPQDRRQPFSVSTDMAVTPWNAETRLLRIGLRGYDLPRAERPPANLVFLVDVSGSMNSSDKLPLVKSALAQLAGQLRAHDRVSIMVYAGAAGVVLEPTNDVGKIRKALDSLAAGGSTAGGAGLQLAYNIARDAFIEGGVNRVILATDGDFNVGVTGTEALIQMVEQQRDSGITLTTLGFGTGNYNEALMEQVADHANGNYAYIDSALEARKVLGDEMGSTLFTIAHDVKIQVEFNPALVSQYRLIGYENRALREEDFDNDAVDAGEIGAGHQVTAIYEVVPVGAEGWVRDRRYSTPSPAPEASRTDELAFVQLRYKLPGEDTSILLQQPVAATMLRAAGAPRGDLAFASAVAAYGQILRGDPLMRGYSFADVVQLAGRQDGFTREEFLQLASLAGSLRSR